MRRLVLVRHAPTAATRRAAFPDDESLDGQARAAASKLLADRFPTDAVLLCSPAQRARETAEAAGLKARVDPLLGECDFGAWRGRTLAEIHAESPNGAVSWMTDPEAAPHGGESLVTFCARVRTCLDAQAGTDGTTVAITHGGFIAAAVTQTLGAPLEAVWRIKAAPLSLTHLVAQDDGWVVEQVGARP